jgi:hypothetical protein
MSNNEAETVRTGQLSGAGASNPPPTQSHALIIPTAYEWLVDPLQTTAGSKIRQVRPKFVEQLSDRFLANLWQESSTCPTVYEPFPGKRLIEVASSLSAEELASIKFLVVDGAHRLATMRRLRCDPTATAFGPDFKVKVRIVPRQEKAADRAAEAAIENDVTRQVAARRTFCDDMWTILTIQADCCRRLVEFSQAVATAAEADSRPRQDRRSMLPFEEIPDLPHESPTFINAYKALIDRHLYDSKMKMRVPYDPSISYKWMNSAIVMDLVQDTSYASSKLNPVKKEATNRVKWRLTQYALPLDTALADDDEDIIGGNGIVRRADRDIRIWDYFCLVNGSLKYEDYDALSYRRVYNPALNKALARPYSFCAVLMLQKLQHDERDNCGRFIQKQKGKQRHTELRGSKEETSSVLCRMTAAAFTQYDAAAGLLPDFTGIEDFIYPYIVLDRSSFKFSILHQGLWSGPKERIGFEADADILLEHPEYKCAWSEMSPVQRAADAERRSVAQVFIEDIDGLSEDTCHHARSCFGFAAKLEGGPSQSANDCFNTVPASKITNHVLKLFESKAAKQYGFPLHLDEDFPGSESSSSSNSAESSESIPEIEFRAAAPALDEDDTRDVQHVSKKRRTTGPDSVVVEKVSDTVRDATEAEVNQSEAVLAAKAAAVLHLEEKDNVFMSCKTFRKWKKSSEYRSIMGKIALFLLDPPYNIRRKQKSRNSHYDSLSTAEMKSVADVVAEGLRPTGRAYIFCSMEQAGSWMAALREAGGGKILDVSGEVVVRHASVIHSARRTLYHRANAAEFAIHAVKKQTAWKPGALTFEELFPEGTAIADTFAFGNPSTPLTSESRLPTYAAAFDNYKPPTGARLLRIDGKIARPEQKGVNLLRDIIRLLAPKTTDIIVDLFAGTMSTVAAALLEAHPVYACEPDTTCFSAATARIHALQYRRVANGILRDIDDAHAATLRTVIPLCCDAVDILDGEADPVETDQIEPSNAAAHPGSRPTDMEE